MQEHAFCLRQIIHLRMALESFITAALQICCVMHVFSWLRHKNTNNVFRLVLPVYDIDTYVFNFNLVTKQARVNPSVPQPRSGCSLVAVSLSVTWVNPRCGSYVLNRYSRKQRNKALTLAHAQTIHYTSN